jgi:homoserine kinase
MLVAAPASTANCGPGFDVLGFAFSQYFYLSTEEKEGFQKITRSDNRFEFKSYKDMGGKLDELFYKSEIDSGGKGLGSSSAANTAGAYLAQMEQGRSPEEAKNSTYRHGFTQEKHGDNVGPCVYGGLVIASETHVQKVNLKNIKSLYIWISDDVSETAKNRTQLTSSIDIKDAVHNINATARFVLACERGELHKLKEACKDKLHQDKRLATSPVSKKLYDLAYESGASAAWLSGSGPSIAAIFPDDLIAPEGFVKMAIDFEGVKVINSL